MTELEKTKAALDAARGAAGPAFVCRAELKKQGEL